jgi:hypothetical protein
MFAYETFVLLWGASHSQMCCICRVGLLCLQKSYRDVPILVFTLAPDGIFGEMKLSFQSKQLNLASFFWGRLKTRPPLKTPGIAAQRSTKDSKINLAIWSTHATIRTWMNGTT